MVNGTTAFCHHRKIDHVILTRLLNTEGDGALAYSQALAIYLAFLVDKLADLGNSLCPWEPVAECPRNLFGRQMISMTWNFAEGNVLGESSGSWDVLVRNMQRNLESYGNYSTILLAGKANQLDVLSVQDPHHFLISTDPPYYDNVPYADLSDFFYIWLRKSIGDIYPRIFSTMLVPKGNELVADHERWGDRQKANQFFEEGLEQAFSNLRLKANVEFPTTVFYAFKQSDEINDENNRTGWETMLEGLIKSGLLITGTLYLSPMSRPQKGKNKVRKPHIMN